MAKKASKKKSNKKSNKKKGNDGTPQIIAAKGGMTAAAFVAEVNALLDNPLPKSQLRDLTVCVQSIAAKEISEGNPVNLFGLVKITPRLHTKGERMVNKEFGNPESPKVKKTYKAKTSFKTGQAVFSKVLKDAMPSAQKLARVLGK